VKWAIGIFGVAILTGLATLLMWLGEIRSTQLRLQEDVSILVQQVRMQGVPSNEQFHALYMQVDKLRTIHLADGTLSPGGD